MALLLGRAVYRAAALGVAVLLALPGVDALRAQGDIGPARRFGVINACAAPEAARELGAGWERLTFEWAAFQPGGPDDFETGAVEPACLDAAREAGREVVGLITGTPEWAAAGAGGPAAVPTGLDLPVDHPGNMWAAFVGRLAAVYGPLGVHHWIIYDGPDVRLGEGRIGFAGDEAAYARLVRGAFLAAKDADPGAAIHLGALSGWVDVAAGREPYLARLLRILRADPEAAARGLYFDVVTLRVFDQTAAVPDQIAQARAILETAGAADKAIWLETNAAPAADPQGGLAEPVFGITPAMQADFVIQAAALALAAGVERVGIAQMVDDRGGALPWGLVRADGSRRPAFDAFQQAIALFGPAQAVTRYSIPGAELIALDSLAGSVYVLWAAGTDAVRFTVTTGAVGEEARLLTAQGDDRPVRAEPFDWPAAFIFDAPGAVRDTNGFLTVAGAPRILALAPAGEFFRVVYAEINGQIFRLR